MRTLLLLLFLLLVQNSFAQVAINNTGVASDASAMLDVSSTTKGILIPRMSTAERIAIINPVKGLLVFDNTTSSFWYYYEAGWSELNLWTRNGDHISNRNSGRVIASAGLTIGNSSEAASVQNAGTLRFTGTYFQGSAGNEWKRLITSPSAAEILKATQTVDLPAISAGTSYIQTFALANAATGASVSVSPSAALNDGLIIAYARVSSAGMVEAKFVNVTSSVINAPSMIFYISAVQ